MVCGKQEERLCGLGPSLDYVIKGDVEIQKMKMQIVQSLLDNFKCVHTYMEHFKFIHEFFVEDKCLNTEIITNETGELKKMFFNIKTVTKTKWILFFPQILISFEIASLSSLYSYCIYCIYIA